MAGLAFTCLDDSNFNPSQRHRITLAIRTVREKILKAQTPEGYFGNVYSTPLALQVGKIAWGHSPSLCLEDGGLTGDQKTWLLHAS